MEKGKLRKIFAVAASAIVVFSAGGAIVNSAVDHHSSNAGVPTNAGIPGWQEEGLETVVFSGEIDADAVAQDYPFLAGDIQKIKDGDADAKVRIAEMHGAKGEASLFFMFGSGSSCGSHGCPLTVYADEGEGYKKAFEASTFDSIHIVRNYHGSKVALFVPIGDGVYARWNLVNHSFVRFVPTDEPDLGLHVGSKNRPPSP